MQVADIDRPSMLPKEIHPECRAGREVYCRSSPRHFMRGKEHPAIQFEEWSNVSAGGEDPFKPYRIHSGTIRRVCRLEDNKRRHRVDRKLESSAQKARQMRLRQDPSISKARVPDVRIAGAARNRVATASPDLELMTALLRAILSESWGTCQNYCEKQH